MPVSFDRVLKGGRLVDGTGAPFRRADIGIAGDRIAAVGFDLAGLEEIDCTGHVVTPGFIDTHSHSDLRILAEPDLPMKLRQGITLEVLGQDGLSVAPVQFNDRTEWKQHVAGLLGDFGVEWDWSTVADYMARLRAVRPAMDIAYLAPHGAIRQFVMGGEDRRPSADELTTLQAMLRSCLDAGAVGLSTGLVYPPCSYARTDELVALGRVLARRRMPLVVHLRSESDRLLEALHEMACVAEAAGCAVHVSHLKVAGRDNWDKLDAMLEILERARAGGARLTADQYPYTAGSTFLSMILPPWVHGGGREAILTRLRDRSARGGMRRDMTDPSPVEWDNVWRWTGPAGIVVADIPSGRRPEWLGKDLAWIARDSGKDPFDAAFDLLLEEELAVAMVCFSQDESVVERVMTLPFVNVGTDGLLGGRPHPRAYGTFPRIFARYVRERKLLTFEEAVRKMTSQAAEAFGFEGVGLVRQGYRANLVVLDPEAVEDRATFSDPCRFPVGIRDVIVGGRVVIREGSSTRERPGRLIT